MLFTHGSADSKDVERNAEEDMECRRLYVYPLPGVLYPSHVGRAKFLKGHEELI